MALTVTAKNYTLLNACEDAAQWTGETPADVSDFFKEGTQCVGFTVRGSGNNDIYITGSWDLSGAKHLRCWWMTTALKEMNTDANGGMQFYVSDGTNTGYYYVSGSDSYPGGWFNPVIDLSRAVDAGTKPTMTAITTIGIRFNHTAIAKNAQNTWIDHLCICDGLVAYGTPVFDLDDILTEDEDPTNGWGIIRKISGVFYLVGSLTFGDTATDELEFKDISQIFIFEDRKVNANLYNLTVVGNAVGATQKFQLGDVSGGKGISGCTVKSEGAAKYDVTCVDTDVDEFKLYGCTFLDADIVTLPPNAAGREVLSCNFEGCGRVVAGTCKMQFCNFVSSDADAVLISDDPHYVTDCNFINCVNGVELDTLGDGEYDFDNLQFSGCTFDVNNSCGSPLTVAKMNGSNPSTYTGSTVTFSGSVQLTIKVTTAAGAPIVGAFAYIDDNDQTPYIMNTVTNEQGIASVGYTGAPVSNARWRVRKYGYKQFKQLVDIAGDNITLPVTLVVDPQQI